MAQIAYHISTGKKLWNYKVHQGTVLYLALEDDYQRIQSRMFMMYGVEDSGRLKQFADGHCICVLIVHHTRKQPAGDSFEMISGTTGLLGCADGSLLMQKKKRTALEATVDVVGRDQQDQILYLSKDPNTQIWNLDKTETELHREPPDPVLEAVAGRVSLSPSCGLYSRCGKANSLVETL